MLTDCKWLIVVAALLGVLYMHCRQLSALIASQVELDEENERRNF